MLKCESYVLQMTSCNYIIQDHAQDKDKGESCSVNLNLEGDPGGSWRFSLIGLINAAFIQEV